MVKYCWLLLLLLLTVVPESFAATTDEQNKARREKVIDMVISEAMQADFSPALALAMADIGSDLKSEAVNSSGARGVMQLMPEITLELFDVPAYQLFDARTNIRTGIKYFKRIMASYDDTMDIALSYYYSANGVGDGSGNGVETPQGLRVYPDTRDFVTQVLGQREFYIKHPKVQAALDGVSLPSYSVYKMSDEVVDMVVDNVVDKVVDDVVDKVVDTDTQVVMTAPQWPKYRPKRRQSRLKRQLSLGVKSQMHQLDDFSDHDSRLNQMLSQREGEVVEQGSGELNEAQADAELAAFNALPVERQELVSHLRALRQVNLKR